jgi:hypothetical protein
MHAGRKGLFIRPPEKVVGRGEVLNVAISVCRLSLDYVETCL